MAKRPTNFRHGFSLFRQSFREGAQSATISLRNEARQRLQRVRRVPRWIRLLTKVYHEYGLKHILLIAVLIMYQFLGAGIFYFCEASFDDLKEMKWKEEVRLNRSRFIQLIIPTMFNNTQFLFFLSANQTAQVERRLDVALTTYEQQLGIKYTDQKIAWDFWNAMLYAQTLCTTIGYGHLYPSTAAGRVFTMLYAIFGIPLVLSILDDLGKLLTRCLKTPWYLLKCGCRRLFRYCTKQTLEEIRKLDAEDKRDLEIFDLPIPIAISVVIAWIFICSATFCIWERDWDYFVAFYFFFISLSTIGLGDITPTEPKYLLMLFIYIIIGLSLVSMCINLIQAKLERTYEAGRIHLDNVSTLSNEYYEVPKGKLLKRLERRGSSLGVIRTGSGHSHSKEAIQAVLINKFKVNKCSQTLLSFPSPAKNSHICGAVLNTRLRFLPRTLSIDDVMKLVDTEEGDILVLTDLIREESGMSDISNSSENSGNQFVISKSFDANFAPLTSRPFSSFSTSLPTSRAKTNDSCEPIGKTFTTPLRTPSLYEIEEIEEIEDKILLGRATDYSVKFRSRLSLIPEQHSVIDEGDEPVDDEGETYPFERGFTDS